MKFCVLFLLIFFAEISNCLSFDIRQCIQYIQERDEVKSMNCIDEMIKKSNKDDRLYALKSAICASHNNQSCAIDSINKAIEANPKNFYYYVNRATLYLYTDKYNQVLADLSTAINLDDKKNKIFSGSILAQRAGIYQKLKMYKNANIDYFAAMNEFNKVDKKEWDEFNSKNINNKEDMANGLFVDLYGGICICYIELKEFSQALNYCQKYEKMAPSNLTAKNNLASVYIELKKYHEAISTIEKIGNLSIEADFLLSYNISLANYRLYLETKNSVYMDKFQKYFVYAKKNAKTKEEKSHVETLSKELKK
ncbi:tetratricopeptide repeat protein [Candidatus Deianiraea vastatrix]|nr:CDC27 family protein [Candidatus Deianiraea vastatrix]